MKVLIIDDSREDVEAIRTYPENGEIELVWQRSIRAGLEAMQGELFDAVVCNVALRDGSIDDILEERARSNQKAPVIVTADFKHITEAVRAVKMGAHSFIQKPFHTADLYLKIEKAIEFARLELETQNLRGERPLIWETENFVCKSPKMQKVLDLVKKVAPTDTTVMLSGETGTGKELVSGAIHYNSRRADKAFVKVNCAALPITLLESELFGHERGAFTGADKVRIGRFEQANGGSIFFDEITELEVGTQVKLLRVLQEREFERIGSSRTIKVDVRIISATNRDIVIEVDEGRFREDLYYRLNVIPIEVPPLREREEDILPLARHFLQKFAGELDKHIEDFAPDAKQVLLKHSWPGNVRELRNSVEHAVLMADGSEITSGDLNLTPKSSPQKEEFKFVKIPQEGLSLEELEEDLIRQSLKAANWVQKDAAKLLKMSPRSLNYKIAKYGIKSPNWPKHSE